MKKTTEDRLLSDAMLAAHAWQLEAEYLKTANKELGHAWIAVRSRYPIFYLAGILTGVLGVLTIGTFL